MNREQIIQHFVTREKEFKKYAKNIAGLDNYEDLFQECSLMLLEMPEAQLQSYWNKEEGLKPFFLRMLQLQYNSKTSKFHKKYRKENDFLKKHGEDIRYQTPNAVKLVYASELKDDESEVPAEVLAEARQYAYVALGELFPCAEKEMVFDLYIETGSLRKTLAAIHEDKANLFDLKLVHEIVKSYRRAIKTIIKRQLKK